MVGFYYRKPHIPVRSTKIFQIITGVALLNSLFDLITVYTVNHRDEVPEQINLAAHIIFLLSILWFTYLLFIYMRSFLEIHLKFKRNIKLLQSLPVILSTAGILVLPIAYVQGKETDYSLGPKAYALYGSLIIYLILILYYCLRYWDILDEEKRMAIILAVPIYIVTAVVQIILPETLVSVVCLTIILLGLILSNENTEKYIDEKTALFNQYSFETVLEECEFEKQKVIIAVLCFCKTENNFDWKQDVQILQDIHKEIRLYRMQGYHICENGVVFIGSSEGKAQMILERVKGVIEDKYGKENISIETKILSQEESSGKYSSMRNIIAFCTEMGRRFAYIDYLTHIYNRNAFERDLGNLTEDSSGSYIIADLNDLKIVNDTIGHSAGDELLQSFARLLADAVGDGGRAYRQGGDEFAVLYQEDVLELLGELEKQCENHNRSCSIPISYAVGHCKLCDKDFLNVADRMMYRNKREIKQKRKAAY